MNDFRPHDRRRPDGAGGSREAPKRIKAACASQGVSVSSLRITVNLSPASLPKHGSGFDLAIAAAVLAAHRVMDAGPLTRTVHLGEVGLDGRLRPVRGVLPAVHAAVRAGFHRIVVPAANAEEARLVPGADVRGAVNLADVVRLHGGPKRDFEIPPPHGQQAVAAPVLSRPDRAEPGDLSAVVGQEQARLGLEVAAAGGHHVLMVGPPGAGKTMLASRLPGLLPDLDEDDAIA
ncbi:MAG: Mg chelatase-like protein, partial [Micrococcales bacterium]